MQTGVDQKHSTEILKVSYGLKTAFDLWVEQERKRHVNVVFKVKLRIKRSWVRIPPGSPEKPVEAPWTVPERADKERKNPEVE